MADDSTAELATGGLIFVGNDDVEKLRLSATEFEMRRNESMPDGDLAVLILNKLAKQEAPGSEAPGVASP